MKASAAHLDHQPHLDSRSSALAETTATTVRLPSTVGQPTAGFTIPNEPLDPSYAGGLITASAGSFSQFGRQGSNPQYQYPLVYDPKVNYTRILGRHSLKMGFEFQLIDTEVSDFNPKYGQNLHRILQRPLLR